jgi:hypothetical protein
MTTLALDLAALGDLGSTTAVQQKRALVQMFAHLGLVRTDQSNYFGSVLLGLLLEHC